MKICPIPKWICEVNIMPLWNISPGGQVIVNVRRLRCSVGVIDQLNPINENTGMRGNEAYHVSAQPSNVDFERVLNYKHYITKRCGNNIIRSGIHSQWGWQVRLTWLRFVLCVFVKANVQNVSWEQVCWINSEVSYLLRSSRMEEEARTPENLLITVVLKSSRKCYI